MAMSVAVFIAVTVGVFSKSRVVSLHISRKRQAQDD